MIAIVAVLFGVLVLWLGVAIALMRWVPGEVLDAVWVFDGEEHSRAFVCVAWPLLAGLAVALSPVFAVIGLVRGLGWIVHELR